MRHNGQLQIASARRRGRLGESVAGCLFAIALVLGGCIWGYFRFVHWKPLVQAETGFKTFQDKKNWPARLEYGRRLRGPFDIAVRGMADQVFQRVKRYKKGEFKEDKALFEQECKTFKDQLLTSISDFNGQEVPATLEKPHRMMARVHKLCYEATLSLETAEASEGLDRERAIADAEKKAKEAWQTSRAAVLMFQRIWGATNS